MFFSGDGDARIVIMELVAAVGLICDGGGFRQGGG